MAKQPVEKPSRGRLLRYLVRHPDAAETEMTGSYGTALQVFYKGNLGQAKQDAAAMRSRDELRVGLIAKLVEDPGYPLNGTSGYTEALREWYGGSPKAAQHESSMVRKDLAEIGKNSRYAAMAVQTVLDYLKDPRATFDEFPRPTHDAAVIHFFHGRLDEALETALDPARYQAALQAAKHRMHAEGVDLQGHQYQKPPAPPKEEG